LSEDILADVQATAATYGVAIARADVKDLVFPGNLQEVMNRVLAAERMSEAQLVEARTKAEVLCIDAQSKSEARRIEAEAAAQAERIATEAELAALDERRRRAEAYREHPALLRLEELSALRDLAANANARLYIDFQERMSND
jgi:regulator of protease activity HflC (stomatin/prohibitin superfamily)